MKDGDLATLTLADGWDDATKRAVPRSLTGQVRSFKQDGTTHWELVMYRITGYDDETRQPIWEEVPGQVGGSIQHPAIGYSPERASIKPAD